jgi:hypothetical protein
MCRAGGALLRSSHREIDMMDNHDKHRALEEIAAKILNIPTLDARRSDLLDFHEVAVWSVKEALEAAFALGRDRS